MTIMSLKMCSLGIFFLFSSFFFAQELQSPSFGNGIFNLVGKDSSWTMKIGARVQFLALANWKTNDQGNLIDPSQNFLIRRSRLKMDGFAYSPKLKYKLELGLSNRDMAGTSLFTSNAPRFIMDAVLQWNFYDNFELWVGQTKLPGNIERIISSGNMQLVDRSLVNRYFNIDRDIGIQLHHHFNLGNTFLVREKFAFSQGEGRNVTVGNFGGHQYTLRLELLPFGTFSGKGEFIGSDMAREKTPKLMVAAAYDFNDNAVRSRSNLGIYMVNDTGFYRTDISTFFADAMFKYRGFSFMAEYAHRVADDPIAKNSDGTPTGFTVDAGDGINLQTGYLFKGNWEIAGRFTHIALDEDNNGFSRQNQYTLGFSKYILGHNLKLQSDISYSNIVENADQFMYRLQFDIHF